MNWGRNMYYLERLKESTASKYAEERWNCARTRGGNRNVLPHLNFPSSPGKMRRAKRRWKPHSHQTFILEEVGDELIGTFLFFSPLLQTQQKNYRTVFPPSHRKGSSGFFVLRFKPCLLWGGCLDLREPAVVETGVPLPYWLGKGRRPEGTVIVQYGMWTAVQGVVKDQQGPRLRAGEAAGEPVGHCRRATWAVGMRGEMGSERGQIGTDKTSY